MCDSYVNLNSQPSVQFIPKPFTILVLQCWQREYGKRPYRYFEFKRLHFEERMHRNFDFEQDFPVIINFLFQRLHSHIYISGIKMLSSSSILRRFVECMERIAHIELKLMEIPWQFFQSLCRYCSRMSVKHLSFEGTDLSTDCICLLRYFLIKSKTLRFLNVSRCNIDQNQFGILADGIDKSQSLIGFNVSHLLGCQTLSLDTTKLMHTVSTLLSRFKLQEVEMEFCNLQAQDIELICEYVSDKRSSITKLNFGNNKLGPDGAKYLLRAIAQKKGIPTLTHLNLCGNGLGDHGGGFVAKYHSSCYTLTHLNIKNNGIGHNAIQDILTSFKKPVKILSFKLYGNEFSVKNGKTLHRLLDARVLPQDVIDITATYDEVLMDYRVIPYL